MTTSSTLTTARRLVTPDIPGCHVLSDIVTSRSLPHCSSISVLCMLYPKPSQPGRVQLNESALHLGFFPVVWCRLGLPSAWHGLELNSGLFPCGVGEHAPSR
jgi:hypothetical protein